MLELDFLCPSCSQILGMNFVIPFPFPNFGNGIIQTRSELIKDIPAHPPVREEFWSQIFRYTVCGWQKQSILPNIADFYVSTSPQAVVGRSKVLHNVSICPSQPVAAVGDSEGGALLYKTYITGFQRCRPLFEVESQFEAGAPWAR